MCSELDCWTVGSPDYWHAANSWFFTLYWLSVTDHLNQVKVEVFRFVSELIKK